VQGQHTAQAEATLARDPVWAVPLLWRSEFRNMRVALVRRPALDLDGVFRIAREAELVMAGREYAVVTHQVLQLAARSGCTSYDCELVALTQELGVPLVTGDRAILEAFPDAAVALAAFAGLPGA